ncbi:MFS transporter [Marinobacter sp. M3C]|uniref:MFS transporter n=1 Tax=Marinobacter sp. M3C TaxID=2917715 RepID=UPI00200F08F7|nr:MFS transporter [Marinobacter sp. M3C]UQG60875.1 MFS transporter [Marinobacter sp. M3C]
MADSWHDPVECWSRLAVLASAMLLSMTTWFSATAVAPQLLLLWDMDSGQAAWLTIAVQVGFIVGALASAALSLPDWIPPRRLMLYGALGAAAANALLLLSPNASVAIALRLLTGIFLAGVYPPAMKSMATWFRYKRGTALGVMVGALTLGSATPHLINGLGGLDWEIVIALTSLLTLAGGLVAEFLGRDGPYSFPPGSFNPGKAWEAFTQKRVLLASFGYFGHMWELYAMWAWFSVFFADTLLRHSVPSAAKWAAIGTFVVIGIGAVGCWIGGIISDNWGRARTAALSMLISGSCAVVIGFMQDESIALVLLVGLIWGFWVVADSAQFSVMVTEVAAQQYVGTVLTLQLAIGFALTIPTIWLIPLIQHAASWGWAMAFLGLGPLLGAAAMRVLIRTSEKRSLTDGQA